MAKEVTERLIDDTDGSTAAETVVFGLDGYTYEVDLNEVNAKEIREFLGRYMDVGRQRGKAGKASDAATIRAWAREQDIEVPDRGRIPGTVRQAYEHRNHRKKKT
jgi:hypothetical protein